MKRILLFAATTILTIAALPAEEDSRAIKTSKIVRQPNCNKVDEGIYPAQNCNQYYLCTKTLWWYNPELHTCPGGQIYSDVSKACIPGSCEKKPPARLVIPPTCNESGPGVFVAPNCNQYYECVKTWWWYELKLKSCSARKRYDPNTQMCVRGTCNKR